MFTLELSDDEQAALQESEQDKEGCTPCELCSQQDVAQYLCSCVPSSSDSQACTAGTVMSSQLQSSIDGVTLTGMGRVTGLGIQVILHNFGNSDAVPLVQLQSATETDNLIVPGFELTGIKVHDWEHSELVSVSLCRSRFFSSLLIIIFI